MEVHAVHHANAEVYLMTMKNSSNSGLFGFFLIIHDTPDEKFQLKYFLKEKTQLFLIKGAFSKNS